MVGKCRQTCHTWILWDSLQSYTPENKHGTWKHPLGKGQTSTNHQFSGSMFVLGGVSLKENQTKIHPVPFSHGDIFLVLRPWPKPWQNVMVTSSHERTDVLMEKGKRGWKVQDKMTKIEGEPLLNTCVYIYIHIHTHEFYANIYIYVYTYIPPYIYTYTIIYVYIMHTANFCVFTFFVSPENWFAKFRLAKSNYPSKARKWSIFSKRPWTK